jgi:3-phytase
MISARLFVTVFAATLIFSCKPRQSAEQQPAQTADSIVIIKPLFTSDSVRFDSDDPAVWINPGDPQKSLIIGTDKGGDTGDGALFVFDLQGKEITEKTVKGIKRPNNVDVAYGFQLKGVAIDIAVCSERNTNSIRVFSLPDMKSIDNGGIAVFEKDTARAPMGIALFKSKDGKIYAIVSRKNGASGTYLWQYELVAKENVVTGQLVRKFGEYSGKHEIESVAVDNELGYVYYSDEGAGVRKYFAHPDSSSTQLAFFGTSGFTDNHEGISIYKLDDRTGYILVSDQQANQFQIFPREGITGNPHEHPLLKIVKTSTVSSDGSEITSVSLPEFAGGLFVAMSDDKTFQFYRWKDIAAAAGLKTRH